jgi:hypothetical protein
LYSEASEKNRLLPAFNAENLTSTEAIIAVKKEFGENMEQDNLPITIGIAVNYNHRSQAVLYSHAR